MKGDLARNINVTVSREPWKCAYCESINDGSSTICSVCGKERCTGCADRVDHHVEKTLPKPEPKPKKNFIMGMCVAACIIGVILIGIFFGSNSRNIAEKPNVASNTNTTKETTAPEKTPRPTAEPVSTQDGYVERAEALMADGEYEDALDEISECIEIDADSEAADKCFELFDDMHRIFDPYEPETGEELFRTIQYQGGGVLKVQAVNGPTELTVTNTSDTSQYVRFYVRFGETAEIKLPAAVYEVTYKVGLLWFGDDIGFGDHYYYDSLDEYLDFNCSTDNAWITNTCWEITV